MKTITFTDSSSKEEISIAYSDYGNGDPVVLIHGWPLSREMWEYQLGPLVDAGHRVVKYDRRGFGKSSKPWTGYDYDTLASDLNELMEQLDLRNVTLVGFSMGGGEAVRYISTYGEGRISRLALISSVTPFMKKTENNETGVDPHVLDEMIASIKDDRIGFLDEFGKKFFGVAFLSKPISTPLLHYYRDLASRASARSTIEAAKAFAGTDFRNDLAKITVPTIIIHGDADKTVPIEVSAERTAQMIPHAEYAVLGGAPHGLFYTHKEDLNKILIDFVHGKKYEEVLAQPEINPLFPPAF